jgi:hypothetical protein
MVSQGVLTERVPHNMPTSGREHTSSAQVRNRPGYRCTPMEVTANSQGRGFLFDAGRPRSKTQMIGEAAPEGWAVQSWSQGHLLEAVYQVVAPEAGLSSVESAAGTGWADLVATEPR